jgi:hypothetical protein
VCGSVNGEHPVGALLTKKRGKDVVVIDGQQRITTTMLLCVALRTAALALKDNELDPTQTYHVDLRIYILERALLMDTDETKPLLEPSFPDRATFAELVCPPAPSVAHTPLNCSPMAIAKRFFDSVVEKDLTRWKLGGVDSQINRLKDLVSCALDGMQIERLDVKGPINFGQVFLYMQERALLSAVADIGVKPRALDLVRNLLLSAFASRPLEVQETIYHERWRSPLELQASPSQLDDALTTFLPAAGDCDRFACEFEQAVLRNPHSSPGVVLYARFVSYFAKLEKDNRGNPDEAAGRLMEFVHMDDGTLTPAPRVKLAGEDPVVVKTAIQALEALKEFVAEQTGVEVEEEDAMPITGPDPSEMFADIEDY